MKRLFQKFYNPTENEMKLRTALCGQKRPCRSGNFWNCFKTCLRATSVPISRDKETARFTLFEDHVV